MTIIRKIAKYGWKRDIPDVRDFKFSVSHKAILFPQSLDNRSTDWGIYDQGNLGSCTANSSLSAYRNVLIKEGHGDFDGSRLAQYYWSRALEHTTKSDAGAEIRDAVKVLAQTGTAPEKDWPYLISKFAKAPTAKTKKDAKAHVALQYQSVALTQNDICGALFQNGNVIIGISVYESFESDVVARTGMIPLPSSKEQLLGGHAIELLGYDLSKGWAIGKNSWGSGWGDKGYFYIPFSYITNPNLGGDYWTLSVVK